MRKTCTSCRQEKPLTAFSPAGCRLPNGEPRTGLSSVRGDCRECNNRKTKARLKGNRPAHTRKYHLKKWYGLTPEGYQALFRAQGGVCAICFRPQDSSKSQHLFVDHDHVTGKVRGLLCHGCNVGLGNFKDNTVALASAIRYLDKEKEHL